MKIMIYRIIMICLATVLCCGCSKAPLNEKVEGFWILKEFTAEGQTVKCERLYYSITRMVTEVAEKQGQKGYGAYIGRTEYRDNGKTLVVKDLKIRVSTGDNGQNAPLEMLRHFGINSQKETAFEITQCNGKEMTLTSDYAVLKLEKF